MGQSIVDELLQVYLDSMVLSLKNDKKIDYQEWVLRDEWPDELAACLLTSVGSSMAYFLSLGEDPKIPFGVELGFGDRHHGLYDTVCSMWKTDVKKLLRIIKLWKKPDDLTKKAPPFFYVDKCLFKGISLPEDLLSEVEQQYRRHYKAERKYKNIFPALYELSCTVQNNKKKIQASSPKQQQHETVKERNLRWQSLANKIYKDDKDARKALNKVRYLASLIHKKELTEGKKPAEISTIERNIYLYKCVSSIKNCKKAKSD